MRQITRTFAVVLALQSSLALGNVFRDPLFRINEEPQAKDWRYFMKLPEPEKDALWVHFTRENKVLKDWSWAWRMGWIKSCKAGNPERCHGILNQGLQDQALVVRTEAVKIVGERFQGTESKAITKALYFVFRNKENYHHGEPLQIQQHILYALKQVGGGPAMLTAKKLAAEEPGLKDYWVKLQKVPKE